MTLAALKRRLTPGAELRMVWNFRKGDCNLKRTVVRAQTNAIAYRCEEMEQLGWTYFTNSRGKSLGLRFEDTADGFKLIDSDGTHISTYAWGH